MFYTNKFIISSSYFLCSSVFRKTTSKHLPETAFVSSFCWILGYKLNSAHIRDFKACKCDDIRRIFTKSKTRSPQRFLRYLRCFQYYCPLFSIMICLYKKNRVSSHLAFLLETEKFSFISYTLSTPPLA